MQRIAKFNYKLQNKWGYIKVCGGKNINAELWVKRLKASFRFFSEVSNGKRY